MFCSFSITVHTVWKHSFYLLLAVGPLRAYFITSVTALCSSSQRLNNDYYYIFRFAVHNKHVTTALYVAKMLEQFFLNSVDRALWYICVIKTNKIKFSLLIYFNNHPLHVSNTLTIHHQEVVYCICSIWYSSCWKFVYISNSTQFEYIFSMINTIC